MQSKKRLADFVIICLGREAIMSEWVRRDCEWALEREKKDWNGVHPPGLLIINR